MDMTDGFTLILSFLAGAGLGGLYFGGLWLTVQHLHRVRWQMAVLLGSFLGRSVVVAAGVYGVLAVAGPGWKPLALCLLGFVASRAVLIRRWGPGPAMTVPPG